MRWGGVLTMAAAVVTAGSADAQAIPRYSTDQLCAIVKMSVPALNACVEAEQASYDLLRTFWFRLSPASRLFCLAYNARETNYRYTRLEACAEGKYSQEERQRPPEQFHY